MADGSGQALTPFDAILIERNISSTDLAHQMRLSEGAIRQWRRGACTPNLFTAKKLGVVLGMSLDEVCAVFLEARGESIESIERGVIRITDDGAATDDMETPTDDSAKEPNGLDQGDSRPQSGPTEERNDYDRPKSGPVLCG